ncbi:MAG: cyclic nucleotide-binding domain-containing protein [Chlorobi bacterium]|nr:cyclic nucleotide-binding domain-containing protein [Chlorobiota bacterium]
MVDLLQQTRLFRECTRHELEDIARYCQEVRYREGQRIFEAEQPAENIFIVKSGIIDLTMKVVHYTVSQDFTIDRKSPGDMFGWSALTEPYHYTLSAVSMIDSEVLKINRIIIKRLCEQNIFFGYMLMKNIATIIGERFALARRMLTEIIQQDLSEKEL